MMTTPRKCCLIVTVNSCRAKSFEVVSGTKSQIVCTHTHTRCAWPTVPLCLLLMYGVTAGSSAYVVLTLHHGVSGPLTFLHCSCLSACLHLLAPMLTHSAAARDATYGAARRLSLSYCPSMRHASFSRECVNLRVCCAYNAPTR